MANTSGDPDKKVRGWRYARAADRDIEGILGFTASRFGPRQRQRYAELIDRAADMIAADPNRPGSRGRDDLGAGIRSFPVEGAVRRRGGAAHVLYYAQGILDDGRDGVIILRVLHERMDPVRHIVDEP